MVMSGVASNEENCVIHMAYDKSAYIVIDYLF